MALSVTSAYSLIHDSKHVHNHNKTTGILGQASLPPPPASPAACQSLCVSFSAFKRSSRVLAIPEDKNSPVSEVSSDSEEQVPTASEKKSQVREAVKKGQTTAIITGAIAVVLGAAYLLLVQLLDSRGINLVPPPPEAFEP